MDRKEFYGLRQGMGKTQKEMAQLLGTSLRGVQSFEQGWRKVPVHIERQLLFLWAMKKGAARTPRPCWKIRSCPPHMRENCPAWEFGAGHLCWFMNGTICRGEPQETWARKMKLCRQCPVFAANMKTGGKPGPGCGSRGRPALISKSGRGG